MQTLQDGYRGMTLLLSINWDRLLSVIAIVASLLFSAYVGSMMLEAMTHPQSY